MKKFAVFCPVKDENTFFPIWLKYYSQFLPSEDIYVLDFNSSEEYTYNCNVIKTSRNIFDAHELFLEIKRTHSFLLEKYEYVIPTDVDELLFHPNGLDVFLKNFKDKKIKAKGYEIIHLPDKEESYDPNKKIFEQRNFWFRSETHYDKTLITKETLNWCVGLHCDLDEDHYAPHIEQNLLLLHLHRFDYQLCIERHLRFANKEWSERTIKNNNNWHYRTKDIKEINEWYFSNSIKKITEIPEELKILFNI